MDKRLKHLNALRSFESAARHQSYSKAAAELFVSQAAISQQMRQLEQSLSVKLFMRTGRNMILTQSGVMLYKTTRQALELVVQGLNSIQCEPISGDLTITSTHAFCSLWLMPRLYKFALIHPDVNIKILGSNQIEDLQKKHIDLAIRFGVESSQTENTTITLDDFGTDVVYPVCSPLLLQKIVLHHPKDLLQCNLVSLANERLVTWRAWFDEAKVEGFEHHKNKTEVTTSDMALSAVLSGHGVTLAASAMFSQYLHTKQLVIPFEIKHPVVWKRYLAYDTYSPRKNRINVFTTWLKSEITESKPSVAL